MLHIQRARGVDKQALSMAATQHGERGRGRAEDGYILDARRGSSDEASDLGCLDEILRRDDDASEATEGGHGGATAGEGLGDIEAINIPTNKCVDDRRFRFVRLNKDAARLFAPPGAAGYLANLLEAPFRRAQIAA